LVGVEGCVETTLGSGFARANLAGEQANAALTSQEGEPAGQFLQSRRREKIGSG